MKSPLPGRLAIFACLSATLLSCSPDSPTITRPGDATLAGDGASSTISSRDVARIIAAAGDNQVGVAGKPLGAPITVRMLDASGKPVAGAAITFSPKAGVASSRVVYTDAQGNATVSWTLGAALGTQSLTASNKVERGKVGTVTVVATALSALAVQVEKIQGDAQTAGAGAVLPTQLAVKVTRGGVPAANTPVTWTVASGGGTLSAQSTTTGTDGYARVTWTLGSPAGTQTVNASAAGAAAVAFEATATRRIARIVVTPSQMNLSLGATPPATTQGQITAVALDSLGAVVPTKFTYSVGLPESVSVDSSGLVTAIYAGAYPTPGIVTVSAGGKSASVRILVTYVYGNQVEVDRILIGAYPGPSIDTRERDQQLKFTVNFKVPVDGMTLRIRSPSGATVIPCSGYDSWDATYKLRWVCSLWLSKGAEGGLWTVDRLTALYRGQTTTFTSAQLTASNVPIQPINVIAYPVDHDAPVVDTVWVRYAPSGNNATFSIFSRVSDAGAGLKFVRAYLRGPSGQSFFFYLGGIPGRVFSGEILMAPPEPGVWTVDKVEAGDLVGNNVTLTEAQLRAKGWAIDVIVPD